MFIFNTRNTINDEIKTSERFEHWRDFVDYNGAMVKVYGKQRFDPANNIISYTIKRIWKNHEILSEIALKCIDYETLTTLLKQSGFEVLEFYGSFGKDPFDPLHSKDIIVICNSV